MHFEGYGWFTINVLQAYIFADQYGNRANIYIPYLLKPYFKLFVDGKLVLESPKREPTESDKIYADDDITYQSGKIEIISTIKLELWGGDDSLWRTCIDKLIFTSEGSITSFLREPFRKDDNNSTDIDTIETISFWRDEYR